MTIAPDVHAPAGIETFFEEALERHDDLSRPLPDNVDGVRAR